MLSRGRAGKGQNGDTADADGGTHTMMNVDVEGMWKVHLDVGWHYAIDAKAMTGKDMVKGKGEEKEERGDKSGRGKESENENGGGRGGRG